MTVADHSLSPGERVALVAGRHSGARGVLVVAGGDTDSRHVVRLDDGPELRVSKAHVTREQAAASR